MRSTNFFQVTIKNMECSVEALTKKMVEIKITDDFFLGNDLSYEENFLNSVIEKFGQAIKDCEVSFFLHRKSMTICCEILTMTDETARKLLKIVDQLMDKYWCTHYVLDKSHRYCKEKQFS